MEKIILEKDKIDFKEQIYAFSQMNREFEGIRKYSKMSSNCPDQSAPIKIIPHTLLAKLIVYYYLYIFQLKNSNLFNIQIQFQKIVYIILQIKEIVKEKSVFDSIFLIVKQYFALHLYFNFLFSQSLILALEVDLQDIDTLNLPIFFSKKLIIAANYYYLGEEEKSRDYFFQYVDMMDEQNASSTQLIEFYKWQYRSLKTYFWSLDMEMSQIIYQKMIELGHKGKDFQLINIAFKYLMFQHRYFPQLRIVKKYCEDILKNSEATIKTKQYAYYFIGFYWITKNNYKEFMKNFSCAEKNIVLNSKHPLFDSCVVNIAESFNYLGYYSDAIECSKTFLNEEKHFQKKLILRNHKTVCEAYKALGNYEKCKKYAEGGIRLSQNEKMGSELFCYLPLFHQTKNLCTFILEGKEETVEFPEKAMENIWTKQAMGLLYFEIYLARQEYSRAFDIYSSIEGGSIYDGILLKLMGIASTDLGNLSKAIQFFYRSIDFFSSFNPTHSELRGIYESVGFICEKVGDLSHASEYRAKAKSIPIISFLT